MSIVERIFSPFYKQQQAPSLNGKTSAGKKSKVQVKSQQSLSLNPYRAVVIVYDECACESVKALASKQFLVSKRNAPILPLVTCDAEKCRCKYEHRDDRREYVDSDRRYYNALQASLYESDGGENRRMNSRGRRRTDI